ncbi:hypothetical protein [Paraglaciecola aestuariivivens]
MIYSQLTSGVKKELWEFNKTLFWMPLIIALVIIATPLLKLSLMESYQIERLFEAITSFQGSDSFTHYEKISHIFMAAVMAIFAPFVAVSLIIQLYYFTSCMFDERRDMSVYFWRSMPVSDALSIAVKLVTGAILVPAIFMLGATAVVLVFLILLFIFSLILSFGFDVSVWAFWGHADILSNLASNWLNLLPYAIWMLPVFAWLMLASMFANKAPFLWAVLPVIGVLLVEAYLVEYFALDKLFILSTLVQYFSFTQDIMPLDLHSNSAPQLALFSLIANKISVLATFLAACFIYLVYWLRVNRG